MNPMFMPDFRGQADWNADWESGAPGVWFTTAARPIDLLDEDVGVHRPTPTVLSTESFDAGDDVGRYLPLGEGGVAVREAGFHLPSATAFEPLIGSLMGTGLFDPVLDGFFIEGRIGEPHSHGPFGADLWMLQPLDGVSDGDVVASATAAGDPDAFVALPHGEAFALPSAGGVEDFSFADRGETFGGGDDPHWIVGLLPAPDDIIHYDGPGHPGQDIDPWG